MRAAYIIFADNPDNQVAIDERLHRGRSLDGVVSEVMGTGRLRSRKVIGMWVVDAEGAMVKWTLLVGPLKPVS